MNLEDARKASHAHPPQAEREQLLKEQLAAFRKDFYGHLTHLERIVAWEDAHGSFPDAQEALDAHKAVLGEHDGNETHPTVDASANLLAMVRAKAGAERALDDLHGAIEVTLEKLDELNRNPEE